MAKKKRNQLPANVGDFAGPDADKENIEKLAAQAAEANKKAGHNGGEPLPEVLKRNADAIEVALGEIDAAGRIMQKARQSLGAALKTAKTDLGSKAWASSVEAAVKLKRQSDKGGVGGLVTEHRQIGAVLRAIESPLATTYGLFNMLEDADKANGIGKPGMDAELQGQHAQANNEPVSNNPFTPGTADFVDWEQGWNNAMAAQVRKMGPGNGEAAAH